MSSEKTHEARIKIHELTDAGALDSLSENLEYGEMISHIILAVSKLNLYPTNTDVLEKTLQLVHDEFSALFEITVYENDFSYASGQIILREVVK